MMRNALFVTLLVAMQMLGNPWLSTPSWAETRTWDGSVYKCLTGSGSKEDPYQITTAEELAYTVQNFDRNLGICSHRYFKLMNDLNLDGTPWPFGTTSSVRRSFTANFDGNGHKISNIVATIDSHRGQQYVGLFPMMGGDEEFESVIQNLEIDGIRFIYATPQESRKVNCDMALGGLVGKMDSNSRIENCIVRGFVLEGCPVASSVSDHAVFEANPLAGSVDKEAKIIASYGTGTLSTDNIKGHTRVSNTQGEKTEEHNGFKWHALGDNQYSFQPIDVTLRPVDGPVPFQYEAIVNNPSGKSFTYRWSVNGKQLPATTQTVTVDPSYLAQNLSVEAVNGDEVLGSDAYLQDNDTYSIRCSRATQMGLSFTIETQIKSQNDLPAASTDFIFKWLDAGNGYRDIGKASTLTGALPDHSYILLAQHRLNPRIVVGYVHTLAQPIYVCNQGISAEEAARYTHDGKSYKRGNDDNDGHTPETAVRTLRRAYELLRTAEQGGATASNVIVIMGDYQENAFTMHLDGKRHRSNPNWFEKNKPALITGQLNNFHDGRMFMAGPDIYLNAETCFAQLNFYGTPELNSANLFACGNILVMGTGISMSGYSPIHYERGLIEGTNAPSFNIYGGYENLDDPDHVAPVNMIRLQSGNYGRIICGGSSQNVTPRSGSVYGSPQHPIRTSIICDIANGNSPTRYQYDIPLIVGGQTNGSCFANTDITVEGSSVIGRIVGGNLGSGRNAFAVDSKGRQLPRPADSFFGQTSIHIHGGTINELLGGSLGRYGHSSNGERDSSALYFYGRSIIDITGGTIMNSIYGGGAGAISGLDYDDSHHSNDPLCPYLLSNGKVEYGPYSKAHNRMPHMALSGDSLLDLNKTTLTINISGNAHLMGSVYGGGYAFSNQLIASQASSQLGNVYGETHINISGGVIKGYVFGGGRGTISYFDNQDGTGHNTQRSSLGRLAQVFGTTHINISGGEIVGMVYGGGEGSFYRPLSSSDPTNALADMAAVYGSTHVDVSGMPILHNNVFGAGNYAHVKRTGKESDPAAGSTFVHIGGGKLGSSVFGGGHGHYDEVHPERSVYSIIEGDTHLTVTDGKFFYNTDTPRYFGKRSYGLFGSGLTTSIVKGNTWLDLQHSPFTSEMLSEAGFVAWSTTKGTDHRFLYCGGGYGPYTDVMGDTHVSINVKGAPSIDEQMMTENGDEDRGEITAKSVLFMDVYGGGMSGQVYGSTHVDVKGNVFIRNLFGGGMLGACGINDRELNGDSYTPDYGIRNYKTGCYINLFSGGVGRLFGGGQMGDVCGETFITIGSDDIEMNSNILVEELFGGNDLTGSVAGGNNPNYGTHINILGGKFNSIFGSGNGQSSQYDRPGNIPNDETNRLVGQPRPHVASTSIKICGTDANHRTDVKEFLYCGGNNTTVGLFSLASNNRPEYNMLREELIANSGSVRINIGSHVKIANLVMGNNGRRLMEYAPSYTLDGKDWYLGFEDEADFRRYCKQVDISCVPVLTFNHDNEFHNDHAIDDRMNRQTIFETPGEMDAQDIEIKNFIGGSYAGSMTGDSLYQYTLPTGVTITDKIVGGCMNSTFTFNQKQGPNKGTQFKFIGGMRPYRNMEVAMKEQRIQLNIFCQFDPVRFHTDAMGQPWLSGARIYGGCLDRGVVVGVSVVNLHSNMVEDVELMRSGKLFDMGNIWNSSAAQVFGGGMGERTESVGNTYVALHGALFNGVKCAPMVLYAFGGGEFGNVVGRSNVYCDAQCPGEDHEDVFNSCVWGGLYGGSLNGDITNRSSYFPELPSPKQNGTHVRVWSGQIRSVFGGSRNGDVSGASFVDINDRARNHCHTFVYSVFGGNDLSGTIGYGTIPTIDGKDSIRTNTYVHIHAEKQDDGSYNGFPCIGEVFGGGNGNYGTHDKTTRKYTSGKFINTHGRSIDISGMALPDVDSTYVEIDGGTIWGAYGGANTSYVNESSVLDIHFNDDPDESQQPCGFNRFLNESCYNHGKQLCKYFSPMGGFKDDGNIITADNHIRFLYGGNKNTDMTIQPTWKLKGGSIHDLYGGCNAGDVVYKPRKEGDEGLRLEINSDKLTIDNVYGGCRLGNVWSEGTYGTVVDVKEGQIGRVFGGNDISGTIEHGTHLQLEGGLIGQVFGSGNGEYIYVYDPEVDHIQVRYDPDKQRVICHLPATEEFGGANATTLQKVKAIERVRPNIDRVFIEIGGLLDDSNNRRTVYISDAVFAGGNCATIVGKEDNPAGDIQLQINDYSVINNLYLGNNGKPYIDLNYINDLLEINHVSDLHVKDENGRGLFENYMDAVTMHGLPTDFRFHRSYERCYIGSFFIGGANSSISTHGAIDITFPRTLNIFQKIVGGSDQARVSAVVGGVPVFYDGGILWDGSGERPSIDLDVQCHFLNREMVIDPRYKQSLYLRRLTESEGIFNSGARVYGGCFLSGRVEGEVNVMLSAEEE